MRLLTSATTASRMFGLSLIVVEKVIWLLGTTVSAGNKSFQPGCGNEGLSAAPFLSV
jgi:hypothetical protein